LARSRLGELLLKGEEDRILAEVGLDHQDGEMAIEVLRRLLDQTLAVKTE
jgi:hypothetical protein